MPEAIYDVTLEGTWVRADTAKWEFEDYFKVLDRRMLEAGLDISVTFDFRPFDKDGVAEREYLEYELGSNMEDLEDYLGMKPDPTYFGDITVKAKSVARHQSGAIFNVQERFDTVMWDLGLCRNPDVTWL